MIMPNIVYRMETYKDEFKFDIEIVLLDSQLHFVIQNK